MKETAVLNLTREMRVAGVLNPENPLLVDLADVSPNALKAMADTFARDEDAKDTIRYLLETIRDLQIEKKEANRYSFTDELTGLYGRRAYWMLLDHDIKLSARHKEYKGPSLLYADLSLFKGINDKYGHVAGDHALQNATSWIKESCRDSDVVTRVGGDEFAVILPNCDKVEADQVANRITEKFNQSSFEFEGHILRLGINIGVAEYTVGETPAQLTERADAAMYANKVADPARKDKMRGPTGP